MIPIKIVVVIPAYNEAGTLTSVVKSVRRYVPHVIVVDDHSTDATQMVLRKLPVTIIRNQQNQGYTRTLEIGLKKAFRLGADYAITFDADGQHDPRNLSLLLKAIKENMPDIIIGHRDKKNRLMEYITGYYSQLRYGFSDPLCGLKVIRRNVFLWYGCLEKRYTIGTELLFAAAQKGYVIREVPMHIKHREGKAKFGGSIKGNWLEIKALLNIIRIP